MLSEINMKAVASHHHERMRWVVVAIDDRSWSPAGKRSDFYFPTFMHPGGKECHAQ